MNPSQFLTLSFFAFLVCGCVNGDAECFPEHRSLLLKLKHGFAYPPASWEPSSDCCHWEGITCDPKSGHVIGLDLGGRIVAGFIDSDALFGLTSLRALNLSNTVFDEISISEPGFEKLRELRRLDLSDAGFHGHIPIGISCLARLEYLDLSVCTYGPYWMALRNPNFSTMIRNLHNLRVLKLGCVDLHRDPEWITALLTSVPHLQVLDLHRTNLKGTVAESFGNLKNLSKVDLSSNRFTGVIPTSFGKLAKITHLDLSSNRLTGPVPLSLFSLPLLQSLDLSHNHLSGELNVSLNASTSLREIALYRNQLCGQIPPSFFYLPSLETLALESNNFSGAIKLDRIAILNNLRYLGLSNNRLSLEEFVDNNFFSFPNLKVLRLASYGLTKVPTFLKNQKKLDILDLSNNRIGPDIPRWLWSSTLEDLDLSHNLFKNIEGSEEIPMSRLNYLDLSSNMLHGPIPIPPPSASGYVDFSNNSFSSAIPPEFFFNRSRMISFSAANNNLSGEIPPSICNATSLLALDLSNNLFTGSIPSCLLESGHLSAMHLRRNRLQGTIPRNITRSCQLNSLILNDNHLEGSLPRSLVHCSILQVLDLGNNHIMDTFPFWLEDKYALQVLILRSNRFYGPLRPTKSQEASCTFSSLQILDLSSNNFNGKLSPKCFSGLMLMMNLAPSPLYMLGDGPSSFYKTNIAVIKGQDVPLLEILYTVIDFSNNSFEGDIPPTIAGLRGLNVLNLSHNSLTGNIPCELGSLTQLQSLDLSTNHLSGKIPQCLTSLTFLESLNLSKNDLSGGIPQDRQFSTFSNASFQENPGLCGVPLSKQCVKNAIPMPPAVISDHSSSSSCYVIGLALSIGIGYGVGISIVIVLLNVPLKFFRQRRGRCY